MTVFRVEGQRPYHVQDIERIRTPRLLVFQDRVFHNITRMRQFLEDVIPDSGFHHLCAHIKTHKSSRMIHTLSDLGMSSFKTSLNEVELALKSGAKDVFVAYPILAQDARYVNSLADEYPDAAVSVQIGSIEHARILQEIGRQLKAEWRYFVDVDVGMHRTGIPSKRAFELFEYVSQWPNFQFAGLHGYDGHNHQASRSERRKESIRSMESLLSVVSCFQQKNVPIPRVVVAGSLTFDLDLSYLYPRIGEQTLVQVSPGTWIYWDSEYHRLFPKGFEIAAVILAQVIDVTDNHQITLNLGHKRWGADRGPVELFSHPLKVVSFNEEHTVLKHPAGLSFTPGDYVLVVPKHICSSVNLYAYYTLIGDHGQIVNLKEPVDGRNC